MIYVYEIYKPYANPIPRRLMVTQKLVINSDHPNCQKTD